MHQTDAAGNSAGLFTDGNAGAGIQATVVDAAWLNDVQQEICNTILAKAGIALVKGTQDQLSSALDLITQGIAPGGRLSLTTAVPVTTADVTGATNIRYTPYLHDRIMLWDATNSRWTWRQFAELTNVTTDNTKNPAAVVNNSNYDLFVWNDAGTLRLGRGPLWTSDTARGTGAGTTELEFFGGRWVNKQAITNGPVARAGLYVGTVRSDGAAQVNDSLAKRHCWNMYNRVDRPMKVVDTTDTWNYTLAAFRQANGAAANQLDYVVGMNEDPVTAEVAGGAGNSAAIVAAAVGVGVDSTTVNSALTFNGQTSASATSFPGMAARYSGFPGLGRHFLAWLEYSTATGTTTWVGDNGGVTFQSGITGRVRG